MTPGPAPMRSSRPRRGRFRLFLFGFLAIFSAGFYVGTRATKQIAVSGPTWVKHFWGVEGNWIGFVPPAAPVTATPAPGPSTVTPIAPAPTANAPAINTSDKMPPGVQQPVDKSVLPGAIPPTNRPADSGLETTVNEYNATLRRAENAYYEYKTAMQAFTAPDTKIEVHNAAGDRANVSSDDFQAQVKRAQTLYDQIHADPQFPMKYKETEKPLNSPEIHDAFRELSVDNLRLIRPK